MSLFTFSLVCVVVLVTGLLPGGGGGGSYLVGEVDWYRMYMISDSSHSSMVC